MSLSADLDMNYEERLAAQWRNHRHCEAIERENALARPCAEYATLTYVDEEGLRHSYCPAHAGDGVAEARRGWRVETPLVAA